MINYINILIYFIIFMLSGVVFICELLNMMYYDSIVWGIIVLVGIYGLVSNWRILK